MREWIIQLLTAFLGSLGFALLFGVRRRHLFAASLGGLFAWAIFLAVDAWLHSGFLACLLASAFSILYSELLARRRKTPATLFVVPAIIPLVPGSSLYSAMACVVRKDFIAARAYGTLTLEYALAIAAGISFVLACRELRTRRQP